MNYDAQQILVEKAMKELYLITLNKRNELNEQFYNDEFTNLGIVVSVATRLKILTIAMKLHFIIKHGITKQLRKFAIEFGNLQKKILLHVKQLRKLNSLDLNDNVRYFHSMLNAFQLTYHMASRSKK